MRFDLWLAAYVVLGLLSAMFRAVARELGFQLKRQLQLVLIAKK